MTALGWGSALVLLAAFAVLGAGCESTQEKSERVGEELGAVTKEKGLRVARPSRDVKVVRALALNDRNGTAAVVELKNTGKRTLVDVPLAIDVRDRGKSVFRNDAPGLEPSLVSVAVLRPGESIAWVHDQVFAPGRQVEAKAGETKAEAPAELPRIEVSKPRMGGDPTSGIAAEGTVVNRSDVLQRKFVLFAVARKAGRIVAAGRGQVERLKPGKRAKYQIFFIGNPEGAQIDLAAPPTTFQ